MQEVKRKSHCQLSRYKSRSTEKKVFAHPLALFNCRPPTFRSRKPVPTKDAWRTGAVLGTDATDSTFLGNIHPPTYGRTHRFNPNIWGNIHLDAWPYSHIYKSEWNWSTHVFTLNTKLCLNENKQIWGWFEFPKLLVAGTAKPKQKIQNFPIAFTVFLTSVLYSHS